MIEAVAASPLLLSNAKTLASTEADLIWNIFSILSTDDGHSKGGRANAARVGRARVMARVLEYLRGMDPLNLSIPQLCEAAGVEQRSLEYAFRETFDLTPVGFLKLRRLHSARHRLMLADPTDMAVSDIAYQEGFFHLGRFAGAYRSVFGVYPSETLQQPCPKELRTVMTARPLSTASRR